MRLHFAVLYGSVRSDRQGIKAARFIVTNWAPRAPGDAGRPARRTPAAARPDVQGVPQGPGSPESWSGWPAQSRGRRLRRRLGRVQPLIPPALSNLLDHFLEEYFFRPSAIVCYSAGAFGGVRAAMQLRMSGRAGHGQHPLAVPVPKVQEAFDEEGSSGPGDAHASQRFLDELEWYAKALQTARAGGTPY